MCVKVCVPLSLRVDAMCACLRVCSSVHACVCGVYLMCVAVLPCVSARCVSVVCTSVHVCVCVMCVPLSMRVCL